MNVVWTLLVLVSVGAACVNGTLDSLGPAMLDAAKSAAELALSLVGALALWLGLLRVVEDGGGILRLSRLMAPLFRRLFPRVPAEHPAMGNMLLNLSANLLGLANAATPFGLRAMEALDRLNGKKGTATNEMILFVVLNTAAVKILPVSVMAVRAAAGSRQPGAIIVPTFLASLVSAAATVLLLRAAERIGALKRSQPPVVADDERIESATIPPLSRSIAVGSSLLMAGALAWLLWHGGNANRVASALLPLIAAGMILFGLAARLQVYESAVSGAKNGFDVALRILPYLVLMLVAVAMCRASGLLPAAVALLSPLARPLGIPAEIVPQILLQPLSGSGTIALLADTLKSNGPDSFVGFSASVLCGSSETTFYVLSVYFGAIGVKRMRHALLACLVADAISVASGVTMAHLFY